MKRYIGETPKKAAFVLLKFGASTVAQGSVWFTNLEAL